MVFGVGEETRVRPVCGVPDYRGGGGFVLGFAAGGIVGWLGGMSSPFCVGCKHAIGKYLLSSGRGLVSSFWSGLPPCGIAVAPAPAPTLRPPPKAQGDLSVF